MIALAGLRVSARSGAGLRPTTPRGVGRSGSLSDARLSSGTSRCAGSRRSSTSRSRRRPYAPAALPPQVAECRQPGRGHCRSGSARNRSATASTGGWPGCPGTQCFQVEFRELTIRLPRLPPAWDGLTILHLTDLHFCGTPGREFYRTRDRPLHGRGAAGYSRDHRRRGGQPAPPQMDRADPRPTEMERRRRSPFSAITISITNPVLVRRRLRRIGVRVIGNGWEQIDVRGEPLTRRSAMRRRGFGRRRRCRRCPARTVSPVPESHAGQFRLGTDGTAST